MEADAVDVIGAVIVADKATMVAPARTGTISERNLLIIVSLYAGRLPQLKDGKLSHEQWLDECRP